MENKENIRLGEKVGSPYRSAWFYSVANKWFFSVRETGEQDPFFSKLSAETGLKMYLSDINHFKVNM